MWVVTGLCSAAVRIPDSRSAPGRGPWALGCRIVSISFRGRLPGVDCEKLAGHVVVHSLSMQSLTTFAALLLASVLFVPLFKRAGLGTVLGYLAVGMLIGPFGVKLVRDPDNLLHTAELGVVLLLFVIGLELKPSRLWALRRPVFGSEPCRCSAWQPR